MDGKFPSANGEDGIELVAIKASSDLKVSSQISIALDLVVACGNWIDRISSVWL